MSKDNNKYVMDDATMTYTITKIEIATEKEFDYGGGYTEEDVKAITKGYKFNGMWYERKNGKYMFIVDQQ